jgi:PAS domain S-box-containing protein
MTEPKPVNQEIHVLSDEPIMVKTDRTGTIEYVNLEYATLSEYEVEEVIGHDVSFLMHPDVPTTVFDHIWADLFQKKRTYAVLKNISKTGKFFWLQVNFDFRVNEDTREIENIYAYYSKASLKAKQELDILYKKIKNIEIHSGIEVAENYLNGYLDERSIDYSEFIESYIQ